MGAKKSIPAVAAASLVLGGGCGDDGASLGSVAHDICRGLDRCDPEYFAEQFTSLSDCRQYYEAELDEDPFGSLSEAGYGEECLDALLEFYVCYAEAYPISCSWESAASGCEALYSDFLVRCGG